MNEYLTEEYIEMVKKHMKRCSASYAIGEFQIKMTMSYYYTLNRMAKSKSLSTENHGKDVQQQKPSFIVSKWEIKIVQPLWKSVWQFFFTKKDTLML